MRLDVPLPGRGMLRVKMELSLPRKAALCAVLAALCCMAMGALTARAKFGYDTGQAALEWPGNYLVQAGVRWDAGWYERIAREGYWYKPNVQSPVAFFPGYPLAIRGLSALGMNRWLAGELITLCCGLLGIVLFARWAQRLVEPKAAMRATALLALYPFAFYLYGVMYSDALFLVLVVGAFLALESERVWLAALLGALATATRPVAPAVVLGLTVRWLELRARKGQRLTARDLVPALSGAGMACYMAFLAWRFGDPLAFAHAEAAPGWDHTPELRTWLKVTWFEIVTTSQSRAVTVRLVGHAILTLWTLLLAIPARRLLGWGYAVFIAVVIGIPAVSSKDLQGLGRYAIAAFPCFVVLALLLEGRPKLTAAWLVGSGALLLFLAGAFGATVYVA